MRLGLALPAALLAGLAHTAAFAPTGAWWLQILALAALIALVADAPPRRAALLGAAFGSAWLASGLWWLYISMHEFGHIPALLAALAVLLLALFLSLYYAGAAALAARLKLGFSAPPWAACWLLAELARASWFSGFPWLASGYAHSVGPLALWAPWIGVYGICALAAACAAALAGLLAARRWKPALALLGLLVLGALLPRDFTESGGHLRVSLLQPNVPQDQKFDQALMVANLERLARQIESARGQLVVTPESVVPLPLDYLPADYLQRLQRSAVERPLLLGVFLGNEREGFVNSLIAIGGEQGYSYGKRHLLPFGEFVPPGFHWFVRAMGIPMEDQARGQHQRAYELAGQRLRPLICYEDLFGEDFVDSVVGPAAASVLVNVSNLAWFGELMVQDQHLQFSQMRALEFQRPFIRSTNTGATAVLDHRGRLTAALPPAQAGVLEAEVEGRSGSTPYARWLAACGLWPLWALALLALGLAGWRRRAP
ncbi:apolipoprotein N-acyltransferase [Roseateles violae]|uniref:Apolipoprotein N-acyltransferase n=1 Tax=Roseateles violae TaxID=3058042 RepID=A0ABT8DYH6_9BURK|nr:apolipoprotein N-acyltransferase [Pelomonas sp. PFR6]MDN3922631.1 apolipoprotein N-acyltransferase [Pelomonas sp. PFR6]